mmetsp:Transcript_42056/g.78680  ORF Transcript_42056/g.78680 Transcript_42056/m.78680 type:complete len:232 (-) Transcript_42056:75-770(-)
MNRLVAIAMAFGFMAGSASAQKKPIVTTEIFFETAELMQDIYTSAWASMVEPMLPKVKANMEKVTEKGFVEGEKLFDMLCAKAGLKKDDISAKLDAAKGALLQVKANAYEFAAKTHDKLSSYADIFVSKFEAKMPKYAGLVPKTPGDVLFFIVYLAVVVYVLVKLTMLALKVALRIFCCACCCCGCKCCCRKSKSNGVTKNGKHATNGKAATNGKVAATNGATNGKQKAKK